MRVFTREDNPISDSFRIRTQGTMSTIIYKKLICLVLLLLAILYKQFPELFEKEKQLPWNMDRYFYEIILLFGVFLVYIFTGSKFTNILSGVLTFYLGLIWSWTFFTVFCILAVVSLVPVLVITELC